MMVILLSLATMSLPAQQQTHDSGCAEAAQAGSIE
jgi:hypothetical protein